MITQLSIKNFAIIEKVDCEIDAGLSVVTGETGAGKSIIIDALSLALGSRADAQVIRAGEDRCEITLYCQLQSIPAAIEWLNENQLTVDEECLLRRVITKEGKSKAFINGTPCTLQQLKELGSLIIHIHGQHQHQALVEKRYQLSLLDHFAGHKKLLSDVSSFYSAYHDIEQKINTLESQQSDQAKIELLRYQVEELTSYNIAENEYSQLDQEQRSLANTEKYLTSANAISHILQDDPEQNILSMLYRTQQLLQDFKDSTALISLSECLKQAIINCEEAHSEIQAFLNHCELNPERLNEVEKRLSVIHTIARKHHIEPEKIFLLQEQLQAQLDQLENGDKQIQLLKAELSKVKEQYLITAKKLSDSRQKSAAKLGQLITEKMRQLNMEGGQCVVALEKFSDDAPRQTGLDSATLMVSTNPGQPLMPLAKVASGGEISRIALAIHVICAEKMTTPAMVFDEVDVGIGGSTAAMVGRLLRDLANHTQIICITHLPQVAAFGKHHFSVRKQRGENSTVSDILSLNSEERLQEIARMLGGTEVTKTTLANAQELVSAAEIN